jgi:hypothetical protein
MNLEKEINKLAYELFVKSGCITGRDMDNWLEAERIVMEKYNIQKPAESALSEEAVELAEPAAPAEEKTKKTRARTTQKKVTTKKTGRRASPKKAE